MCNLNFIWKRNNRKSKKVTSLMNILSWASYQKNDDGDGIVTENYNIIKQNEKYVIKKPHSFILSHQRLATSGKNDDMIQPLESDNFIIAHNGVINELGDKDKSDTYEYLMKLEEEYKNCKDIIKTIQNVNKTIRGSFSILLIDKNTKKLYYYKESHTKMYMTKNDDFVVMSTKEENIDYAMTYLNMDSKKLIMNPYVIVDVYDDLKVIGEFEEKPTTVIKTHKNNYFNKNNNRTKEKNKTLYDYNKQDDFYNLEDRFNGIKGTKKETVNFTSEDRRKLYHDLREALEICNLFTYDTFFAYKSVRIGIHREVAKITALDDVAKNTIIGFFSKESYSVKQKIKNGDFQYIFEFYLADLEKELSSFLSDYT